MNLPIADVNQPRDGIIGFAEFRDKLESAGPDATVRIDPRAVIRILERIPPGKRVTLPVKSVLHLIYSGDDA